MAVMGVSAKLFRDVDGPNGFYLGEVVRQTCRGMDSKRNGFNFHSLRIVSVVDRGTSNGRPEAVTQCTGSMV